jgi:hypothetical protein
LESQAQPLGVQQKDIPYLSLFEIIFFFILTRFYGQISHELIWDEFEDYAFMQTFHSNPNHLQW